VFLVSNKYFAVIFKFGIVFVVELVDVALSVNLG
jgi:hypothetical protein